METKDDRKERLARHLAPYIERLICPICGTKAWEAQAKVVTPFDAVTRFGSTPAVPWGLLICSNCGFAHFFAWNTVEKKTDG